MKKFIHKFMKNKYSKFYLMGGGLFIVIFTVLSIIILGNKITADKLLMQNFSGEVFPSKQELKLEMECTNGNDVNLILEDERDEDTDKITGTITSPNKKTFEMYVTKIDKKNAVYRMYSGEKVWALKYVPKNMSDDDVRTNYIEKNNEINLSEINVASLVDAELSTDNDNYIIKGKINYITTLAILGNLRQGLLADENYSIVSKYLLKNGLNLFMDVTFYFDKETKLISKIEFVSNSSFEQDKKNNNEKETPSVKKLKIILTNLDYSAQDIFVPNEVDKNSVRIDIATKEE